MTRQLVVGGTGFLGRALQRRLAGSGADFIFRRRPSDSSGGCFNWIPLDRLESLPDDYGVVYHLAAHIPYGVMNSFSQELLEANIRLTERIVSHFSRARIVFASSVSVYGAPQAAEIAEDHAFNAPGAYGLSKVAAEVIVACTKSHCILRFSSLYGEGMNKSTFLPRIIDQARSKGVITLYGNGRRLQNYLAVDEAAEMLEIAAGSGVCGIFNAVSPRSISNLTAAEAIAAQLPGTAINFAGEDTSADQVFSSRSWTSQFSYIPPTDPAHGIARLALKLN